MRNSPPGSCEARVVVCVENADRLLRDVEQFIGVDPPGDEIARRQIETSGPLLSGVSELGSERNLLVEQAACVLDVAGPPECETGAPERFEARGIVARDQLAGTEEEAYGGARVVARE